MPLREARRSYEHAISERMEVLEKSLQVVTLLLTFQTVTSDVENHLDVLKVGELETVVLIQRRLLHSHRTKPRDAIFEEGYD